jgi:hypothetical protein
MNRCEPVTLTLLGEWTAKTINEGRKQELRGATLVTERLTFQ